jgi:hypothetical protein
VYRKQSIPNFAHIANPTGGDLRKLIAPILFFFLPFFAQAQHEVTLNDGVKLEGRITEVDGAALQMEIFIPSRKEFSAITFRVQGIARIEEIATGTDLTEQYLGRKSREPGDPDVPARRGDPILHAPMPDANRSDDGTAGAAVDHWEEASNWPEDDEAVYNLELGFFAEYVPDRQWLAGVDVVHAFRPLRHDREHSTVASKRVLPQSWIGGRGNIGPYPDKAPSSYSAYQQRWEGAVLISPRVGIGGVLMHTHTEYANDLVSDYEYNMWVYGLLLDFYPSRKSHLREIVAIGDTRSEVTVGSYYPYNYGDEFSQSTDLLYFEHQFDVLFGSNAYSHRIILRYLEGDWVDTDFINELEFGGNPEFTYGPMLRLQLMKSFYDQTYTNTTVGVALRWYVTPKSQLMFYPQFALGDEIFEDDVDIVLDVRYALRF